MRDHLAKPLEGLFFLILVREVSDRNAPGFYNQRKIGGTKLRVGVSNLAQGYGYSFGEVRQQRVILFGQLCEDLSIHEVSIGLH